MSRQPSDFHEACHDPRCCRKPLWKTVDHPALVDAGTVRRCVACIEIKGWLPRGSIGRSLFLGLHGLFGLSIFALVWVRLSGRLIPRPPVTPAPPAWQTGVSHKPVPYFGFFLPAPVAVDPDLAKQLKYGHE